MGLMCVPRIFTGLKKVAVKLFRKQGVRIVIYKDDILIVALTEALCEWSIVVVMMTLEKMGLIINIPKSCFEPDTKFIYLGYLWNTV